MSFRVGGVRFSFSFWFFALIALFSLLDRQTMTWYFLLPVIVHELGHLAAMGLVGTRPRAVEFTAGGINMRRGEVLSYRREAVVSLGGVAANGLFALLLRLLCFQSMRIMFLIAANVAVALFHLLPVGDLDGGQLLAILTAGFLSPDTARAVKQAASVLVLSVLFGFAIFLLLGKMRNPTLLVLCLYLAANVIFME